MTASELHGTVMEQAQPPQQQAVTPGTGRAQQSDPGGAMEQCMPQPAQEQDQQQEQQQEHRNQHQDLQNQLQLQQQQQQQDSLRAVALRMRLEMPLKERIIHLQTFRWTFTGQQAVVFLQQQGLAANAQAAADLCQRMLSNCLFKSIYHRELFSPDGEVYRFSSSFLDGSKQQKGLTKIPGSITSTGLYKEIAKFGKTAAQPFKNIQLSLNDTFNSLGSLSIPTPPKPGSGGSSSSNHLLGGGGGLGGSPAMARLLSPGAVRPRSSGGNAARAARERRSAAGKLLHAFGEGSSAGALGPPDAASSLAALVGQLEALQAGVKESTSLLRLDLQQHTALQEHLVGLLVVQQDQARLTQLLIAVNATALLLLLGGSGGWGPALAACCLLCVVLWVAGPRCLTRMLQAGLGIGAGDSSSSSRWTEGLQRGSSSRSLDRLLSRSSRGSVVAGGDGPRRSGAAHLRPSSAKGAGAAATAAAAAAGGIAAGVGSAAGGGAQVLGLVGGESGDEEVEDGSVPYADDFEDWPDAPVLLRPDPAVRQQVFHVECPGPCCALPCNTDPLPFESEVFRGVVGVFIRHLPTTPHAMFKGKKRLAWVAVQGVFKQPVSMDELVYGMEFRRQLSNLPAPWFLDNMLLPLARKISPNLRVGTLEDPYFFTPLITASQVINVALPGQEPPLMEAAEDMSLLAPLLASRAGDGLSVASRRRFFQQASNREQFSYGTEYVWTFHLWQEYIDFAGYMLNLGYSSYDLAQHMDGQPLQVMAKDMSTGQHMFGLQVWHANLVRSAERAFPRPARFSRASHLSGSDAPPGRVSCTNTQDGGEGPLDPASPGFLLGASPRQQQQQQQQPLSPGHPYDQQQTPYEQQQHQEQQAASQQQQQESAPLPRLPQIQEQQLEGSSSSTRAELISRTSSGIHAARSSASDSRLQRPPGCEAAEGGSGGGRQGSSFRSNGSSTTTSSSSSSCEPPDGAGHAGSAPAVAAAAAGMAAPVSLLPQGQPPRVSSPIGLASGGALEPLSGVSPSSSFSAAAAGDARALSGASWHSRPCSRGDGSRGGSLLDGRSVRFVSADSGDDAAELLPLQQQQQPHRLTASPPPLTPLGFAGAGGSSGGGGGGTPGGVADGTPPPQRPHRGGQQQQQQHDHQQQQRKQLQGLSVMGAL